MMDFMKRLVSREKEKKDIVGLSPETLMAAASLMDRSGKPKEEQESIQDEIHIMLRTILKNESDRIDKDNAKALELNETNRRIADQDFEHKNAERDMCSHTKQDGRSRIGGQYNSNGVFHAICTWCQKSWFLPADEDTFPKELMPSPDIIGGASAGIV